MKKDIEWLKGLINEEGIVMDMHLLGRLDEQYWKNENIKINKGRLFYLIDQLDEPETLSEEWITNHTASVDTISYYSDENVPVVTVEKLKNLLVPKQDKPVIPQFVAEWIERQKQPDWDYENKEDALADSIHFTLYSLKANCREANPDVVLRKPINEWLNDDRKNYWKLIDGVRYGYEVEKEKVYHVVNKENYFMLRKDDGLVVTVVTMQVSPAMSRDKYGKDTRFMLTEQEIKDYDERYWAFAQEVTE